MNSVSLAHLKGKLIIGELIYAFLLQLSTWVSKSLILCKIEIAGLVHFCSQNSDKKKITGTWEEI
jgi:hypothetical protein